MQAALFMCWLVLPSGCRFCGKELRDGGRALGGRAVSTEGALWLTSSWPTPDVAPLSAHACFPFSHRRCPRSPRKFTTSLSVSFLGSPARVLLLTTCWASSLGISGLKQSLGLGGTESLMSCATRRWGGQGRSSLTSGSFI